MTSVLRREGLEGHTEAMKVEVMLPQVKDAKDWLAAMRNLQRGRGAACPQSLLQEETSLLTPRFQTSRTGENKFYGFEPPSLWLFVSAALQHYAAAILLS